MANVLLFLSLLSLAGVLGMTVLFPLVATVFKLRNQDGRSPGRSPQRVTIIIPAHNEEILLGVTLKSVTEAIEMAGRVSDCRFVIKVGADGCSDDTAAVASSWGAEVIEVKERRGKWTTISALAAESQDSDWIILADSGVEWPRDFLSEFLNNCTESGVVGIAPAYLNRNAGCIERCIWQVERTLKTVESSSGGPVAVHGATVCYRTPELRGALVVLASKDWLNDDVVIPLLLRALYPASRIKYVPSLKVFDAVKTRGTPRSEFGRRRRMVHGNIEWITRLWLPIWKKNHVAALLASRRIFRVLWAYWIAFTAIALLLYSGLPQQLSLTAMMIVFCLAAVFIVTVRQLRNLFECALASALAPYYFLLTAIVAQRQGPQWN